MIAPVPAPAARTSGGSLLSGLQPQPPDGLLALIGMYARDPRRDKIDVACGCVGDFGVAAACGLTPLVSGMPVERLPEVIEYHRTIAELP